MLLPLPRFRTSDMLARVPATLCGMSPREIDTKFFLAYRIRTTKTVHGICQAFMIRAEDQDERHSCEYPSCHWNYTV